jgi:hypothetical protein
VDGNGSGAWRKDPVAWPPEAELGLEKGIERAIPLGGATLRQDIAQIAGKIDADGVGPTVEPAIVSTETGEVCSVSASPDATAALVLRYLPGRGIPVAFDEGTPASCDR